MFRPLSLRLALVLCGVACAGAAFAQSAPISQSPVPGFGGRDTRPGTTGSSPASSGSAIGSNVGAGATASPIAGDPLPSTEVSEAPPTKPLFGLSRDLPMR
jgi:hypothetical protein